MNNREMKEQKINELWTHLHWLNVLAEQGSFTAAATRLGVSKAAMSQHIADLESKAGVALVLRTTRSVRLSEAGQRLVDDTRASFAQIAQSFAEVRDRVGVPRGLLRVTAPVAFARQQLVPRLADFLRAYPEVRLQLDLSDRISSLATEGFDLAIRHTAAAPDTHVAWTLCATRSVLVASPNYLRANGAPTTPQDLLTHSCLHYPRAQGAPAWTFEPVAGALTADRVTIPVSGALSANNSEALREAALCDLGIALLPDFSAQATLQSGELVNVLAQWRPVGAFADQLFAIRPYSAHVPLAVSVFITYLREVLAGGFMAGIETP